MHTLDQSLDENGIKALVLEKLIRSRRADRDSVIANEYPLHGLHVRADLVIRGKSFIGIEIKSKFDSARRLDKQLSAYLNIFDEVIVVLASRHVSRINNVSALAEIWEVCDNGCLRVISRPRKKKSATTRLSYADHMTKAEIRKFVIGKSTDVVGLGCKQAFLRSFDERFHVTSRLFWSNVGDKIERHNLELLSRFRMERIKAKVRAERAAGYWDIWLQELSASMDVFQDQSLQLSSVSYIPAELP